MCCVVYRTKSGSWPHFTRVSRLLPRPVEVAIEAGPVKGTELLPHLSQAQQHSSSNSAVVVSAGAST